MDQSFGNETQIDKFLLNSNNLIVRNLLKNHQNLKADSKVWDNFWQLKAL